MSSVSHELRTPLSSIKAYMELLIDGETCDDRQRTEFYSIIHSEAERLGRLIDNVLDIGRIESGGANARREVVNLAEIVAEVVEIVRPQAQLKRIHVACDLGEPAEVPCEVDRDMVYQATMNLLSNAVKYTTRNGRVMVTVRRHEPHGWACVSVADTGVGIPPRN